VEGDDEEEALLVHHSIGSYFEEGLQIQQLVVCGDPQGLEGSANALVLFVKGTSALCLLKCFPDDLFQLARRVDHGALPLLHYRGRQLERVPLITEPLENLVQVEYGGMVDDVVGCGRVDHRPIIAHVQELLIRHVAKASVLIVQLIA